MVHAGGITHLRRIAALADLYNVRTGCHGATDLSPVCMSAALHFDISIPNFGIQEWMHHTEETDEVFRAPTASTTACCIRAKRPGSGRGDRRKAGRQIPYKRAFLPVNRLEDGTMYNW